MRRLKKTSKLRVTGLCEGNSLGDSPHKGPVIRKMFPFDDVTMVAAFYFDKYHTENRVNTLDNGMTFDMILETFMTSLAPSLCQIN